MLHVSAVCDIRMKQTNNSTMYANKVQSKFNVAVNTIE